MGLGPEVIGDGWSGGRVSYFGWPFETAELSDYRRPHRKLAVTTTSSAFTTHSIAEQDEESQARLLCRPFHCERHQQSLCSVDEKWEGSKNRSRALPTTGHSLLVAIMYSLPIGRPDGCEWKQ